MILLTDEMIDVARYTREVFHKQSGAVVVFVGTVREETKDADLEGLAYEAYREAAEKRLTAIVEEARARWGLRKALVVHRLGVVPVGEESILIAVSSPHRREAFEAAQWIIDEVKKDVPIWKKEIWAGLARGQQKPGGGM